MNFTLDKCKNQVESNRISRTFYDGVCVVTGQSESLTACHIYPIGQYKFKPLARYPIAALPMCADAHIGYGQWKGYGFEWTDESMMYKREPADRREWLDEYVLPEYKGFLREHLKILHHLCDIKGINYE